MVALQVTSGSLTDGMQIKTVQGCNLAVSIASNGTVTVNGATVVMADLEACNGVVHVIDMVLLPEECGAEPSDDSEVSEVSGSKSIALLSSVVAVASVFVSLVI